MIEDHKKIGNLISSFNRKILSTKENNSLNFKELLNDFFKIKWNLEKHIFTEEKVIINEYQAKINYEEDNDVKHIQKEHKEIIELLLEIEEDLQSNQIPSLNDLIELIKEHEKNEENYFYPKLDEKLDIENKKLILSRCSEIIIS